MVKILPVASNAREPLLAEILAVGVPELTLRKANFAEAVALLPRSRSCVPILSKIAPLPCSKGEPPLAVGRMPVTSDDAKSIAEEERRPLTSEWTIPVPPIPENVMVPLDPSPVRPVSVPVAAIFPLFAIVNAVVPEALAVKISAELV